MQAVLHLAVHHHRFHGPHLDYLGVAGAAFLSWFGLTGPGEAALIAAGILAAKGRVDLASVLAVAWAGATLGGTAGWLLGLRGGRAVMTAPGPLRRVRARMLRSGDRFYDRFGALAVYFAPSWMAGVNGMAARRFLPVNAICCLVWTLIVGLGAYFAGPSVEELLSDIGTVGLAALAAAGLTIGIVRFRRSRRRATVTNATHRP
jgi:membrane protein DedA with SNARE-associated domain